MLNTLPVLSELRHPRGQVLIATAYGHGHRRQSISISGAVSWSVHSNSYFSSDTFRVSFATSALPVNNDPAWFMAQDELYVTISAAEAPSNPDAPSAAELTTLIYGRVDTIEFDPATASLHLSGRDLSAAFIDNKLTTQYYNLRASQIVSRLARARNIPAAQIYSTTVMVGTVVNYDVVLNVANRSEWDVICDLARGAGFVAYVSFDGLYFGPDPRDTRNPYVINWSLPSADRAYPVANVIEMSFERSLTVAKGITVVVKSAQQSVKYPLIAYYPSQPRQIQPGKSSPFGDVQAYYFIAPPNATAYQCGILARTKYNEIISHTMKLRARLAADGILSISTPVRVTGTGTPADQVYFPRGITRSLSLDEGYVMELEAQNTTPELEAATVAP